jgi:two-component system sensor histidine kinase DegS
LQKKDRVTLTVKDNGKGISEMQINDSNSLGLIGMRERSCLLKGDLTIQSKQGQGTTVSLSIPYQEKERKSHAEDPNS